MYLTIEANFHIILHLMKSNGWLCALTKYTTQKFIIKHDLFQRLTHLVHLILNAQNHTNVKKMWHTSEFPFGIY